MKLFVERHRLLFIDLTGENCISLELTLQFELIEVVVVRWSPARPEWTDFVSKSVPEISFLSNFC